MEDNPWLKENGRSTQELFWRWEAESRDEEIEYQKKFPKKQLPPLTRAEIVRDAVLEVAGFLMSGSCYGIWIVALAVLFYRWRRHNVFGLVLLVLLALMLCRVGYTWYVSKSMEDYCLLLDQRYGKMHERDIERYMKHPLAKRPGEK